MEKCYVNGLFIYYSLFLSCSPDPETSPIKSLLLAKVEENMASAFARDMALKFFHHNVNDSNNDDFI